MNSSRALRWPEIDGIDSAVARDRWGDDLPLFREMLEHLLDEFVNVAVPAELPDPGIGADYILSIHRLRGGACMLGANIVVELAGELEAACRIGELGRAKTLASRLAIELRRVRSSTEHAFTAACAEADDDASSVGVEIESHLLVELDTLLRQQNPMALDRFRDVGPQLKHSMGPVSYGVLCRHLDRLQFVDAADELMRTAPTRV